jgi:hypothetical protein
MTAEFLEGKLQETQTHILGLQQEQAYLRAEIYKI